MSGTVMISRTQYASIWHWNVSDTNLAKCVIRMLWLLQDKMGEEAKLY